MFLIVRHTFGAFAVLATFAASAFAQRPAACNAPAKGAIVHVETPGRPFEPLPTRDGCWILVTLARETANDSGGLAVYRRSAGAVTLVRKVPVPGNPTGAVLTHDGTLLIVASGPGIAYFDVLRLTSGHPAPLLGYMDTKEMVGFIYAAVTSDDKYAFVAAERAMGIAVIDLVKARNTGFDTAAAIGIIPHGNAPVGLGFSSDGKYLYSSAQAQGRGWNWPIACKPEAGGADAKPDHTQGAIVVIDVAQAAINPEASVVARVAAGCNPVRLVVSPDGVRIYVTARGDNNLLVFDAQKLVTDTAHALMSRVPVGTAPVGIAVIDAGKHIVVTNSNRFAGSANDTQPLTVVDATKLSVGAAAVLGTIPAGAFPREMRVTADGKTLLVTNFNSRTLEIVDLAGTVEPWNRGTVKR